MADQGVRISSWEAAPTTREVLSAAPASSSKRLMTWSRGLALPRS